MLDPSDRILLIEFLDRAGGRRWWIMPGGGLDPGESHEDAARREVVEETGLHDLELGPWIWRREHVFPWSGRRFHQQERFYLARVPAFEARATGLAPAEIEMVGELRWWSLTEIETSAETFAPRDLGHHLRRLLEDGLPPSPISVGV